jgi:putative peptide maturation system protein
MASMETAPTGDGRSAVSDPLTDEVSWLLGRVAAQLRDLGPQDDVASVHRRLDDLRVALPRLQIEVYGRRDEHSGAVQYHVLVSDKDRGTFCLSYAPRDDQPFALLGAQRWKESELLVVNGHTLTVRDAAVILDFMWKDSGVCRDLVAACLLRRELQTGAGEEPDVETFVEELRRRNRLYSAQSFQAWLAVRGLTLAQFMYEAREHAAMVALRRQKTSGAAAYFEQRRQEFEAVELVRCPFATESEARQALARLVEGKTDFWGLASERLTAAAALAPSRRARLMPSFQVQWRRELSAEQAGPIFSSPPGKVVGPLPGEQTSDLVQIVSLRPAVFDQPTRAAVEEVLFGEWLQRECNTARIEWNWGGREQQ